MEVEVRGDLRALHTLTGWVVGVKLAAACGKPAAVLAVALDQGRDE